jgi:hypothetical protein
MSSYVDVMQFIFHGWSAGFALAVSVHYAAKVFFSPKGVLKFWSGPS